MDKLTFMRAYCRIVERGSFAKAADDLQVSPALLSRDLKLLEDSLGCALIARTTRRMSLTEHGRVYYEEALRILADVERSEDAVRRAAGQICGRLSVNAPHSFGVTVLSARLPEFLERYPKVELTLSFDDRVIDMIEGGYDLTLRIRAALPDSGLIAREIATVRQALFASPAYLAQHGAPQTLQDLSLHPVVGYLHADDPMASTLKGTEEAIPQHARLQVGSSLVLRDLLISSHGIGALPDFLSNPAERDGRLVRVLPQHMLPSRHLYAVTASRRGTDAKTLAFINHLQTALASERDDS
ncbi:LysR family transcriptional regulator [Rhodoferax sp.]|uniref:LysR family transcriptional regulator n=1 Tax=Rhodoferax sp. TaxID=50421 RepID=UPI00272FF49C|nr:LysR family transcriptional regulator [Rhodoferax sp.]MDP1531210.1 LysR family transcriptional regulator [Rhodoferax sp.]MDP1942260.1 LysR family transcriptional regulator [Rhodoferax sp.]MDP2441280.1 LysR family transcriptional regulator [Rhodoferax sp.]MDZ4207937.1 LysR family transcriptional regulator [Rhodoferax sp.]